MSNGTDYHIDNKGAENSNVSETQTDSTNTFKDLTSNSTNPINQ